MSVLIRNFMGIIGAIILWVINFGLAYAVVIHLDNLHQEIIDATGAEYVLSQGDIVFFLGECLVLLCLLFPLGWLRLKTEEFMRRWISVSSSSLSGFDKSPNCQNE